MTRSLDAIELRRLSAALDGRYLIEKSFAHGGNSVLFVGRAVSDGSKVAVKVLSPELVSSVSVARFEREGRIAASLSHPSILPVIEFGEHDGTWYNVLPFIEGETLQQRLAREGQL